MSSIRMLCRAVLRPAAASRRQMTLVKTVVPRRSFRCEKAKNVLQPWELAVAQLSITAALLGPAWWTFLHIDDYKRRDDDEADD